MRQLGESSGTSQLSEFRHEENGLRILVCQMVRMIIAICKERAFTGAIIPTVAKHNRKIYPQALVATEQLIFLEARRMSSYQQTRQPACSGVPGDAAASHWLTDLSWR
jgi:hypothetical protein